MTKRPRYKLKPLSHARATEFRGRWLKRVFGDSKARAERHAWLTATYGPNVHKYMRAAAKGLSGAALEAAIA